MLYSTGLVMVILGLLLICFNFGLRRGGVDDVRYQYLPRSEDDLRGVDADGQRALGDALR